MRDFVNEHVKKIKPSGIRRFFDIANEMDNVISLGVGEPDFDTPWHIRDEARDALSRGRTFYTANAGLMELREEIAGRLSRKHQLEYNPNEEILVTIGGSEAIDIALRATVCPGDEVIYLEPGYVSYLPCIELSGGVPVPIALQEANQFRLTAEELEAAITPKTKIVIMNFPNNPTGAILEQSDIDALARVIMQHDLLLVTDEIYDDLTYTESAHVTLASVPEMKERTVYINGFSKTYAMTGWRLGYCCGPKAIMEQMIKIHQFTIMAAPTLSQYAGIEALKNGDASVEEMRQSYNQRRRYLLKELDRIGLTCFEPLGAFYIFPNIQEFQMSSEDFATQLLLEEHLAVIPGSAFGDSGEGYIRISYAYSIKELKVAMNRLEQFVHRLREKALYGEAAH